MFMTRLTQYDTNCFFFEVLFILDMIKKIHLLVEL